MKKLFTLLACIATMATFAQAPQGFNYQATVRNNSGQLLLNQIVLVKFNILQNSSTGDIVYSETQTANTDDLGQINLVVGQGTAPTGTFSAINWGSGSYYLGIELNTGSGYVAMGATQLMSVPYALNGITTTQADAIVAMQAQIVAMQAQITSLLPPLATVTIGTQTWTTKNLDVATYSDGTPIPEVTDPTEWASLTTGAWCYYNNDSGTGTTYGKLYNWYAVKGIHDKDPNTPNKKLAPTGYHVPSDAEWTSLTDYLGVDVAGGKMKTTGTLQAGTGLWQGLNTPATNESGFSGLPAGFRYSDNRSFFGIGGYTYWWSSSEFSTAGAWYRLLGYDYDNAIRFYGNEKTGFSVRCLRD
jgi:uncharacterized protein (TIGR02145 family)